MPTGYLTRVVEFTATHRFPDTPWFGGATHDHSHRYRCFVTVTGPFDPARGGVTSLQDLDALLTREVVAPFDQRHINRDVAAFADGAWVPTGEAVALFVWGRLSPLLPAGVALHRVRIQEGPDLFSDYYGER